MSIRAETQGREDLLAGATCDEPGSASHLIESCPDGPRQTSSVSDDQLTAIDLFCGAGGLTLGLRWAGFTVVAAVDNDGTAVESYQANHPGVRVWEEDITELPPGELRGELGMDTEELDMLAGCPPCQGFSSIRTRNGGEEVEDARNELIFDFLDYVDEFRPHTVMMENVPGLRNDPRFDEFLEKLTSLGYEPRHRVLNAEEYGVPQNRHRLVVLAGKGGPIPFGDPVPESERSTVRSTIGALPDPGESGDPCHDVQASRSDRIMRLIRAIPKDGGGRLDLDDDLKLDCHKGFDGFKDVYGRMAWDQPAPTITCGCVKPSKGRFLHPEQDRAITPREAALLQAFPSWYVISMSRGKLKAAELIGNALPPAFVWSHAKKAAGFAWRKSHPHERDGGTGPPLTTGGPDIDIAPRREAAEGGSQEAL